LSLDALIRLNSVPGLGRRTLNNLIARFGSASRILGLTASRLQDVPGVTPETAKAILCHAARFDVEHELRLAKACDARLLTPESADYPENLRSMEMPPPLLYVKGEIRNQDRAAVALVGARRCTTYGLRVCHDISEGLAAGGVTIVSGLALGIDAMAHKAAMDAGGRTFAVLGNGLAVCYPPSNESLMNNIPARGALISAYSMQAQPEREHFPERNGIIAALSLGIVVVEADEKSGSLITARAALEENRSVYAVPGDLYRRTCRGTNAMIREGAPLVRSADDVLEDLAPLLRSILQ